MEEKAPTRQVGYQNPDGSVTYISQPKKWVNPTGKTTEQILLEIGEEVYAGQHKKEDVEDLLNQASAVLWREYQDDNHSLYRFIQEQIKGLDDYRKQRSQTAKDYLLNDIAKESRFRIKYHFETER